MKPGDLIGLKPIYQARYRKPQVFLIVALMEHYAVTLHFGVMTNIFLNTLSSRYEVLSEAG